MDRISALCSRLAPKAFGAAVLVLTASLAAIVAHFAIDEAGDFLLRHDTYDHVVHHSRFIALLCALVLSASSVMVLLAAALKDARKYRGELRALVGSHANRSPWHLISLVVPMSVCALLAMESLDAWLASGHIPMFADALGGSIPLGLGIVVCTASLMGAALWRALTLVSASHRKIAAALQQFLTQRDTAGASHAPLRASVVPERPLSRISILASRAGKRAPPLPA
jgi:uncharacterized membrane protein YidH (DUF202 family)